MASVKGSDIPVESKIFTEIRALYKAHRSPDDIDIMFTEVSKIEKEYSANILVKELGKALINTLLDKNQIRAFSLDSAATIESDIFIDSWNLLKAYRVPEDTDEYWNKCVDAVNRLGSAHPDFPLGTNLAIAICNTISHDFHELKKIA